MQATHHRVTRVGATRKLPSVLWVLPSMVGRVPYIVGGVESTTVKTSLHSASQSLTAHKHSRTSRVVNEKE